MKPSISSRPIRSIIWLASLTAPYLACLPGAYAQEAKPLALAAPAKVAVVPASIGKVFEAYCISCHGPDKSKGKITLHDLDGGLTAGHDMERWEKVLKELRSGEMPPEDEEQPTDVERNALIGWIESGMRKFASTAVPTDTTPTARRLTNFEYQNTMRDLLGFELKLSANLPEDPVKPYHFNNTAEFMLIGPEQMDRYLECARRAMAAAIVDPGKPEVHRSAQKWITKSPSAADKNIDEIGVYRGAGRNSASQGLPLKSWPKNGEFRIRIKASAILPQGIDSVPLQMVMGYPFGFQAVFLLEPVGNLRLTNNTDNPQIFEFRGRIENYPVRPPISGKRASITLPALNVTPLNLYDDGLLNDHANSSGSWDLSGPRVVVESIEFEAPVADVWPPAHHTNILFESPLRETDKAAYVREVLRRFMSRAYRRPVMTDELDQFVKIYNVPAGDFGTLEEAMRETLAMVLTSPQFLYHTVAQNGGAMRPYELASKLSYFLWGSMPDDTLLALAAQGRLDDPAVIEAQARRLLADKRSGDFVNNFTTQWLSLAKLKTVNINKELFPRFLYLVGGGEAKGREVANRPTIRDYMQEETVGFIAELIKRNASVTNLVDSDFAVLNQPLAAHYGVADVQGNELRPVRVKPEHHLGGLPTQGSVLVANSTGSAPHPIYRAVWLREAILGEEVKPPPANVPPLSDSAGTAAEKAVTIKDLLRQHRTQESCSVCHASLDPWGIPFEQYNATGKFQPLVPKAGTRVRGFDEKIDKDLAGYAAYLKTINTVEIHADARVPRGPTVDGMEQLKAYLLRERKDDIAQNVLRRLLSYGIGRGLTYRDSSLVEQLRTQTRKNDYRFQEMIVAICQSDVFLGRPKTNGAK